MGKLGLLLITVGTIIASISAARMPESGGGLWDGPIWTLFYAGCIILVVGIALTLYAKKRGAKALAEGGEATGLINRLSVIVTDIRNLESELAGLNCKEIEERLSPIMKRDFFHLVENRAILQASLSQTDYMEIFGDIGLAERFLNRSVSASMDEFRNEAIEYIGRSIPILESSLATMRKKLARG